jgi:hypothetical protein
MFCPPHNPLYTIGLRVQEFYGAVLINFDYLQGQWNAQRAEVHVCGDGGGCALGGVLGASLSRS